MKMTKEGKFEGGGKFESENVPLEYWNYAFFSHTHYDLHV